MKKPDYATTAAVYAALWATGGCILLPLVFAEALEGNTREAIRLFLGATALFLMSFLFGHIGSYFKRKRTAPPDATSQSADSK